MTTMGEQLRHLATQGNDNQAKLSALEQTMRQQYLSSGTTNPQVPGGYAPSCQSNKLVSKNKEPEMLRPKTTFRSWAKSYKTIAGSKDHRFKLLLEWAESQDAPITNSDLDLLTEIPEALDLASQVYASLNIYTEDGTEARTIVDNTPGDNGAEAWRLLAKRFDPATEGNNISLMNQILQPPKGKIDNITYLIEKWEELVQRQEMRTRTTILTESTRRTLLVNMCPDVLADHLMMHGQLYPTYQAAKSFIRDYVERSKSRPTPMDVGELEQDDHEQDNYENELNAIAKGKGRGRWGKSIGKSNDVQKKKEESQDDWFPFPCHRCGKKGHKSMNCPQKKKGSGKGSGKSPGKSSESLTKNADSMEEDDNNGNDDCNECDDDCNEIGGIFELSALDSVPDPWAKGDDPWAASLVHGRRTKRFCSSFGCTDQKCNSHESITDNMHGNVRTANNINDDFVGTGNFHRMAPDINDDLMGTGDSHRVTPDIKHVSVIDAKNSNGVFLGTGENNKTAGDEHVTEDFMGTDEIKMLADIKIAANHMHVIDADNVNGDFKVAADLPVKSTSLFPADSSKFLKNNDDVHKLIDRINLFARGLNCPPGLEPMVQPAQMEQLDDIENRIRQFNQNIKPALDMSFSIDTPHLTVNPKFADKMAGLLWNLWCMGMPVPDSDLDSDTVMDLDAMDDIDGVQIGGAGSMVEITVDSGAAEVVAPTDFADQYPISESAAKNTRYRSATGKLVQNKGERRVQLLTENGDLSKMTFQLTDVNKPLASAGRITGKGNRIVLDDDGSYIENKATLKRIPLYKKKNVFIMRAWIANPPKSKTASMKKSDSDKMDVDGLANQGFIGRGN